MNIVDYILSSLESLTINKLRSGLTMLGIIIGVGAVISMLAIGKGAQASISDSINSIGSNLIFISSGAQNVKNPKPLTLTDADALANPSLAPSISLVGPVLQGRAQASFGAESSSTTVMGVTPDYATIRSLATTEGGFITHENLKGRSAVAVIGPETANNLFGRNMGVVGQVIRLEGQPFRVIGVLESKGGSSFGSQDDQILIPLTTAQSRLLYRSSRDRVDMIMVQARSAELIDSATSEITLILQSRHRTKVGVNDFTLMKQQDILSMTQSILGVLTIFLGGIGGISLLVGGIGIMNIMLVSVTERTREIGLRKALGAGKSDILIQFLMESSVLSLVGGVVGIILAWGISLLVTTIAAANNTPFSPLIGIDSILLATLFSAAVGLFFGIYPANRAANLEPVEALRSE